MQVTTRCRWFVATFLAVIVTLSGCYSSGNNYSSAGRAWLQPGISTAEDARVFLQAEPTNVYRQLDGGSLQVWQHTASLVPDAIYNHKELWLEFDPNDVLRRIVKPK